MSSSRNSPTASGAVLQEKQPRLWQGGRGGKRAEDVVNCAVLLASNTHTAAPQWFSQPARISSFLRKHCTWGRAVGTGDNPRNAIPLPKSGVYRKLFPPHPCCPPPVALLGVRKISQAPAEHQSGAKERAPRSTGTCAKPGLWQIHAATQQ